MHPASSPRGLASHLVSSFAGAAIDNVFRLVALTMLSASLVLQMGGAKEAADTRASLWAMLAFMVPLVALAPLAGALGDRLRKDRLMLWVRLWDVVIVAAGTAGMAYGEPWVLLATLGMLGAASAFFGAVKYSVLPELAAPGRLAAANAWMQGVTVVAILTGIGLGGACGAIGTAVGAPAWAVAGGIAMTFAVAGAVASFLLPVLPAQDPQARIRPWDFAAQLRAIVAAPGLLLPTLSLSGFWAIAALSNAMIAALAQSAWGLGGLGIAALQLCLAVGMIAGAALTPLLIAPRWPAGLPVVGAGIAGAALLGAAWIGVGALAEPMTVTAFSEAPTGLRTIGALLVVAGCAAGAWEVAIQILIQERSPERMRSRVFASVNVATSIAILAVTLGATALSEGLGLTSAQILALAGGTGLALALGALWVFRVPVAGWITTMIVRSLWDIRVHGAERLPKDGGCVIVCNHLSFADGLILSSALPRRSHFLVYRKFVDMPLVGLFLRAGGCIPVAAEDARRAKLAAIGAAADEARNGHVVVIFAEGKLTRSGQMDGFKSGFERVAQGGGVPVVPAFLHGLWDSPTSRNPRRGWPRLRRRVELSLGDHMPADTTAAQARVAVTRLAHDQAQRHADHSHATLGRMFLAQARFHPRRIAIQDAQGALPSWKLGGVAQALFPALGIAGDERCVGVLLPPGRGGTIVNLALALHGRTAVNLNHTAGAAQLARMCELAGIRTVITARAYLKRIGEITLPARVLHAEDLLPAVKPAAVLREAAINLLLPACWRCRARPEQVAALVFSSGSTGDPKGVQLTHRQLVAQCRAVAEGLDLHASDGILSPLPLFHSMGLVPGMWMGLALGLPVAGQPDPTDGAAIAKLRQASGATLLLGTATFVRGWLRRADPAQMRGLRWTVAGAERCPEELKQQWNEVMGSPLLEGYGCTELSPTVSVNLPDLAKGDGLDAELRSRAGTVGRALPGIQVVAVDPATHAELPPGAEGLLVVRSPARMLGYLGRDDLTQAAFISGGYATGDIGKVDCDGFIAITGRLARFAKIGGEMVPLDNVEKALGEAVGAEPELAVSSIPDQARGERLVVLVVGDPAVVAAKLDALEALPPLWRPKAKDVRQVAAIPKLGTGKRDLKALRELAVSSAG